MKALRAGASGVVGGGDDEAEESDAEGKRDAHVDSNPLC